LPFTFQLGDGKTHLVPWDAILKSLLLHFFWEAEERSQKRKSNGPYRPQTEQELLVERVECLWLSDE